jgi:hypothetical protein
MRRPGEPQSWSGYFGEEKHFSSLLDETRIPWFSGMYSCLRGQSSTKPEAASKFQVPEKLHQATPILKIHKY